MRKSDCRIVLLTVCLGMWGCKREMADHAVDGHMRERPETVRAAAGHDHGADYQEGERHADDGTGEAVSADGHSGAQPAEHGHESGHREDGEHGDHTDELLVRLTDEGVALARITTAALERRTLHRSVLLPGEVVFNEEKLAHVAPRFEGIIQEVPAAVGKPVHAGDVLAVIENNEHLTRYTLAAPLSGTVIEKHAVRGEFAASENTLFVIADLATLWVNCYVNLQYESLIREGQRVTVRAVGAESSATGTVAYLPPVIDPATRSLTARVVLPNHQGRWRPGMFVDVEVSVPSERAVPAIEHDALQRMGAKNLVFVPDGKNSFRPVEVIPGERGVAYTEIVGGLDSGAVYVAGGAFALKAHLVTSTLGEHAGHGH